MRSSYMTVDELRAILGEVYPGTRQQRRFSADIGRNEVTVSRWLSGKTPIGETEATCIRLILLLNREHIRWRKWLDAYKKNMGKPRLTIEDLF